MLRIVRKRLRIAKRRNVVLIVLLLFGLTFFSGLFIGQNPETGDIEFGFNPENSLVGRTLNFVSTSIGLPRLIGYEPSQLAFVKQEEEQSPTDATVLTPHTTERADTTTTRIVVDEETGETIVIEEDEAGAVSSSTSLETQTPGTSATPATSRPRSTNNETTTTSPTTPPTSDNTPDNHGRSPYKLPAEDFEIIRFDSFSGKELDTSLWEPSRGLNFDQWRRAVTPSNLETSCYNRDQVFVANGSLHIEARAVTSSEADAGLCRGLNNELYSTVTGTVTSNSPNGGFVMKPGQYIETKISFPLTAERHTQNWAQIHFQDLDGGVGGWINPLNNITGEACAQHIYRETPGGEVNNINKCNGTTIAKDNHTGLVVGTLWRTDGSISIYYNGIEVDTFDNSLAYNHTDQRLRMYISYRLPGTGFAGRVVPVAGQPQSIQIDYVDQYEIVG